MPNKSLSGDEAMRRTERIASLLAMDTWFALRARAALHAANDVVTKGRFDHPSRFGDTYNVVQNSMALTVALALARLFDMSNPERYPIEQQDKASIPVLAHLLMRQDVQHALAERARSWHPQLPGGAEIGEANCRSSLSTALTLYDAHSRSTDQLGALARLRSFRTARLAHHLFDDLPDDLPSFYDLDALADFARDFVRASLLCVEGIDRDLDHEEKIKSKADREFWDLALSATLTAG